MAEETQFAAGACLVGFLEDGSRHYYNGGDPIDPSHFKKGRFDMLFAKGSIVERGPGAQLGAASSAATTDDDLEGQVDKTGKSSGKGGKR